MNTVQRAIAAVTGLDTVVETAQEQIATAQEQVAAHATERTAWEEQRATLETAQEQIYSDYTLLARRLEDLQYIDYSTGLPAGGKHGEVISDNQRLDILRRIRLLRHEHPLAKQAIKLTLRFVFGKSITFQAENPADQDTLLETWGDSVNYQSLTSRNALIDFFDEVFTDGEHFLVMVKSEETPFVRFADIAVEQIRDVLYDPGNRNVPVWYKRVFQRSRWDAKAANGAGAWVPLNGGQPETRYYRDFRVTDAQLKDIEQAGLYIPPNKVGEGVVKHVYINPVRNERGVKRGLPELFTSRDWFRVFREFMEDRAAINAAANALAIQRRIRGGPTAVARISGAIGGVRPIPVGAESGGEMAASAFSERRLTRPLAGSVYDTTDNIDMKNIRLDTGAPQAAQDARMFIGVAGAGTGIPINYFGDPASSLAGAQTVELPLIKMFEDYQSSAKQHLQDIADYVMSVRDGTDFKPNAIRVAWNFPPIVTADMVKWITAFAQFAQQVGPGNNVVRREGIKGALNVLNIANPDIVMDEIDKEEQRLADEKAMQQELQQKQQAAALAGGGASSDASPPSNGNGHAANGNGNGGQKAGGGPQPSAFSPDMTRLASGRPPKETTTGPRTSRQ